MLAGVYTGSSMSVTVTDTRSHLIPSCFPRVRIAFVCYFTAILQPFELAVKWMRSERAEAPHACGESRRVILVNPGISGVFLKTGPGTPLGAASLWYRYRLISAIGPAACKHTIQYKYNNMPWCVKIIQVIQI